MAGAVFAARERTPEQDAAWFEARCTADRISRRQLRDIGEVEFGRIYLAALHRRLVEALEPLIRAKARYLAMASTHSAVVVGSDGFWKFMQAPPTEATTLFDEAIERVKAQYTQGLEVGISG